MVLKGTDTYLSPEKENTVKSAIKDISKNLNVPISRAFTIFALKYLNDFGLDEDDAEEISRIDGTGDGGIDAIYIDDENSIIYLFQSKYIEDEIYHRITQEEIADFKDALNRWTDKVWKNEKANSEVKRRIPDLLEALDKNYEIHLIFLVYGDFRRGVKKLWKPYNFEYKNNKYQVKTEYYNKDIIVQSYFDYFSAKPERPDIRLRYAKNQGIERSLSYNNEEMKCLLCIVPAIDIAKEVKNNYNSIFNLNIRGRLNTQVNKEIKTTLNDLDGKNLFFILNNGLNIFCESIEEENDGTNKFIVLKKAQIINGLQTAIALLENMDMLANVEVVTKIICSKTSNIADMVVRTTNTQNPIKSSDMVSNEAVHIRLENEISNLDVNYYYKRKRGVDTSLAPRDYRGKLAIEIPHAAQAICSFYLKLPHIARTKKRDLFNKGNNGYYTQIFNDNMNGSKLVLAFKVFNFSSIKNRKIRKEYNRIKIKDENNRTDDDEANMSYLQPLLYMKYHETALIGYYLNKILDEEFIDKNLSLLKKEDIIKILKDDNFPKILDRLHNLIRKTIYTYTDKKIRDYGGSYTNLFKHDIMKDLEYSLLRTIRMDNDNIKDDIKTFFKQKIFT
ncbi:MAG: AIPR family protein [Candidatus Aenigmarchaeota archaeon]|nr:AIPR family protein [Candidatus Aenigmarchaeota archaeon]